MDLGGLWVNLPIDPEIRNPFLKQSEGMMDTNKIRPKPTAICANTGVPIHSMEEHIKICMSCRSHYHHDHFWAFAFTIATIVVLAILIRFGII